MHPPLPLENTQVHGRRIENARGKENVIETMAEGTVSIHLTNIDVTMLLEHRQTLEALGYQAVSAITIRCFRIWIMRIATRVEATVTLTD